MAASLAVRPTAVRQAACGEGLWSLKTLSDPRRNRVNLRPRATTVAAINSRPEPERTPTRRTAFELQVWQVTAQITEYKLMHDEDIHLILEEDGAYMIAEMPAADCLLRRTRDRRAIVSARQLFESRCGPATDAWQQLGAHVQISGVGFWDSPHGQTPAALNDAELHPVTGIRFLAGCA